MQNLLLITIFVLISWLPISAQEQSAPLACPKIWFTGPAGLIGWRDSLTFTLEIDTKEPEKLRYLWSASSGRIIEGQGSRVITVKGDPKSKCDGLNVTATVEIEGLPPSCPNSASETVAVSDGCGSPQLVDEYGPMSFQKEKLHLDNAVVQLQNGGDQRLVFVIYRQKNSEMAAIKKRAAGITKYLQRRGVSKKKFTFVYGKNIDYVTKIWLVPDGAALPVL